MKFSLNQNILVVLFLLLKLYHLLSYFLIFLLLLFSFHYGFPFLSNLIFYNLLDVNIYKLHPIFYLNLHLLNIYLQIHYSNIFSQSFQNYIYHNSLSMMINYYLYTVDHLLYFHLIYYLLNLLPFPIHLNKYYIHLNLLHSLGDNFLLQIVYHLLLV